MYDSNVLAHKQEEFLTLLEKLEYSLAKIDMYELRYKTFSELLDKKITNLEASRIIGVTIGHIKKIKREIKKFGFPAIVHKLKGKATAKNFTPEKVALIVSLYNNNYALEHNRPDLRFAGYSYGSFHKQLTRNKGAAKEFNIDISYSKLRKILLDHGYKSKLSKHFSKSSDSKGRKRDYVYLAGERWEIDGTEFDWFGTGEILVAHVVYCRGIIGPVGIYFAKTETTFGYMMAFKMAIMKFGIPKYLKGDQRGTFVNLATKDLMQKYNTRFNNMLDIYGIKYEYDSNANGKPGVEGYNRTLKNNLPDDIKRLDITNIDDLNEYMDYFVDYESADRFQACEHSVLNAPIDEQTYLYNAIQKRSTYTVQAKGRLKINSSEYELFKNGELRQLKKGTKVDFITNIEGQSFVQNGKIRYDLVKSIEVPLAAYDIIKTMHVTRSIKDDGTFSIGPIRYVLLYNDGNHVEIEAGSRITVETKRNDMQAFYDGSCFQVCETKNYYREYELVPRKHCAIKFHCLIKYNGHEYIMADKDEINYQTDEMKKVFVKYHEDGLYAFDGLRLVSKLQLKKEFESLTDQIPVSNHQARRLRDKIKFTN